jgi:hypothetical protein
MVRRAKERLRGYDNTEFRLGDAADISVQDLRAELIVSRFGVMFFGDPVAAFTNLRTGLAHRGRVRFACWCTIQENPWLQVPLHAAFEHVPRLPKPALEEPGPFSFAEPERVARILTAAGFTTPSFTRLDVHLDLAAGGDIEDALSMHPKPDQRDEHSRTSRMKFGPQPSNQFGVPSRHTSRRRE